MFDIGAIRAQFPITHQRFRVHGSDEPQPLIYMDHGASTHPPRPVLDAYRDFLERSYSNVHRGRHFRDRGVQAEIVALSGSIELAPLTGLASRIVDLVSTGLTLRENGLVEVEEVLRSTAHLVVNRTAMMLKHARLAELISELAAAVPPRTEVRP